MQGVDLFITITDRSRAEQFAAWFRTHGISLVLTALGQGTATTEVLDFLGLEATEKAVLFCVSPRSPRLVRQAARDLWLDVPGQGVLMTVPVNSIGGSTAKEYLLHEQEGETAMEREIAHDLIVVIANQGSTDLVMDAAREAGATGGTVIHAKGTGTDLVRKFFGVSIASEQEMVFILARSEAKKPIMKAIMAKAGIQSAAQSLVFSLPVGDIAGLRELEQALAFFPHLRVYSVAGNCDYGALEPLDGLAGFDQTVVFYTHGHMYGVKYDLDTLADAAAARGAEVALFGHSHIPHAEQRGNVFLFNPGSCGRCYTGPDTYGLLTLENGAVTAYEHKEVPKQ